MPERGLLHDLLAELDLSDISARTGDFARPLRVLFVVVAAVVLARLGARTVRRAVRSFVARAPLARSARADQRASTLGEVLASVIRAAVWGVAALVILDEVGINLAPLLAGAGIAGVAIGFGAQSLVKDVISGLFILLEDQYGVGDVVTLSKDATGTVEDLSMRVTRVRATDGTVWFVPNGEIRKVGNSAKDWGRALVDVLVPNKADLAEATAAIEEEAAALAEDPAWAEDVLEKPEVLGVETLGSENITVRVSAKTTPGRRLALARELRARITSRLRREGIVATEVPRAPGS